MCAELIFYQKRATAISSTIQSKHPNLHDSLSRSETSVTIQQQQQ